MRVFVAGLSKSGKTTRSLHAADQIPELEYASISQLLRVAGGILPVATLADGLTNQRIAKEALTAFPRSKKHQIVDGHALVETPEGPLLVPDWFFDEIAPDLLIHVLDDPEQIRARRALSANSDSITEIAALTALEQAACERLATRLGIPFLAIRAPTLDEFRRELERRFSSAQ
ncbi:AAA family ATPase [Mesorhizobium sp. VK25A]|uniref:AAA family ATPase n=2 Tax=Mesorhizobium TaxID=68287 RepID=A0ABU5AEK5_9HYPH|nr:MULTISPECIES: AAA family ATPase [unclassified Mesorhizobium]MDX8469376.1 AAA family ATPase [Mesorhizobium sp. VK23B]MDX8475714.1 AAA family ATPase [Mesorhizobium sp. VK23A]MDX8509006.1 AAA family ATPase [Mesorhizobium sp. VK22E]MDX8535693.1 AAA family ATPase [Mesorhizobium sp. VK25D]MDX8548419.1 AAA family ATPase [Mesorhizobium sp. VK25A]